MTDYVLSKQDIETTMLALASRKYELAKLEPPVDGTVDWQRHKMRDRQLEIERIDKLYRMLEDRFQVTISAD